jgi:hypothetical protein
MARRQSGRARANNSDVVVAAALRGGDAEGVCPDAIGSGELARGWRWTGLRASERAPAHRAYAVRG